MIPTSEVETEGLLVPGQTGTSGETLSQKKPKEEKTCKAGDRGGKKVKEKEKSRQSIMRQKEKIPRLPVSSFCDRFQFHLFMRVLCVQMCVSLQLHVLLVLFLCLFFLFIYFILFWIVCFLFNHVLFYFAIILNYFVS